MNKKLAFPTLVLLSLVFGIYPLTYFTTNLEANEFLNTKSSTIKDNHIWIFVFTIHIITSGISLLIGWIQFITKIRINKRVFHKFIGKIYFLNVIIGSLTGLYLALYSNTIISKIGFIFLSLIWLLTSLYALYSIRLKNYKLHYKWALRSYSITFSAVTFRLWLILLDSNLNDYELAFGISSWLCWVINVLIIELIIQKSKTIIQ